MLPNDLSGFSVEQLRGFVSANREQYDAVSADETLDAEAKTSQRESLLDSRDRLNAEIEARLEAEAAEETVDEAVEGEKPADDAEGDKPAEGETAEGDADGEGEKPADAEGEGDADAAVDDAVAAASMGGGDTAPRASHRQARLAGGDINRFVRGLAHGNVRQEERHAFGTIRRETNFTAKQGEDASEKLALAVAARKSGDDKTAAGCFCGPDDAVTTIKECGETVRPLSDTLPTLTVSGDIRYVRQIDFADALTGVTQWTCADQDDVDPTDPATWKPCFELECQPEITSALYAVPACASFDTQQLIGNPALIENMQHVMEVAYNKTAELLVYQALRALASKYTYDELPSSAYGASAQLIGAVAWAMELIKASLRETDPQYTLALPAGLVERVVADGYLRGFGDDQTKADLYAKLADLGVNRVVELVDEITGTPAPLAHAVPADPGDARVPTPSHPLEQEILLYRPEDFVLGVAPEIDLGITRSPEMARQNKLQWFAESFEFVEKPGCAPAIDLIVPFCESGVRPALAEGITCEVD